MGSQQLFPHRPLLIIVHSVWGQLTFDPVLFTQGRGSLGQTVGLWQGALNTHSPFPLLYPPPNQQPVINSYQMPSYSHSPSWVHTAPTRAAEMQPSWDIVRGGSWESLPARLRGSHVPPSSHQTEKQTCLARLAAACFQMPHSPGSRQALWHKAGALVHEGKTAVDRKTNGLYYLFLLFQRTQVTSHWSLRKDALRDPENKECFPNCPGFSLLKVLRSWDGADDCLDPSVSQRV